MRSLETPGDFGNELDLAGSEGLGSVRRSRVVKQHDMFQGNFEHVPRILSAQSCVLVGVFFRDPRSGL